MKDHLYELLWHVETDSLSFFYRELKVFRSEKEIGEYSKKREIELNGGVSFEERAHDGYYFKFYNASKVKEIDGFQIKLLKP
jgi:hypothetical protein